MKTHGSLVLTSGCCSYTNTSACRQYPSVQSDKRCQVSLLAQIHARRHQVVMMDTREVTPSQTSNGYVSTVEMSMPFVLQLSTKLRFRSLNFMTNIQPINMAWWYPLYGTVRVAHHTGSRTVGGTLYYLTGRYGIPYYGSHKPYVYGYGQQP
jgi:hypothetical protein